jgi:hypothetical protein
MLLYLIGLIGLLLVIIGHRYSYRRLFVLGKEIDEKLLLSVGLFTIVLVVLLKVFDAA